jgi:hypothetical protein
VLVKPLGQSKKIDTGYLLKGMPPITVISILPSFAPKATIFNYWIHFGGGSTVTVTVKLGPAQLPEVGDTCKLLLRYLQCHLLGIQFSFADLIEQLPHLQCPAEKPQE